MTEHLTAPPARGWLFRVLSLLCCLACAVTGVTVAAAAPRPQTREVTWILDSEPDTLDPHLGAIAAGYNVQMRLFDTLVFTGNDSQPYPALAESWESNDDYTMFTFRLRHDVRFHDGEPMHAAAWKYSIERIVNPATKSPQAASLIGPVDHAEAVDDYTLKVVYKTPYPTLLSRLGRPALSVVSPKAAERYGEDFGRNPVGTGPYKFVEWVKGDRIVLERNPDYQWGSSYFKNRGPAPFERITMRPVADYAIRTGLLESGEAQIVEGVDPMDVARLRGEGRYTVLSAVSNGTPTLLAVNTARPPTDDVRVRQAIAYAIDRDTLVSTVYFGTTRPANSVFAPGMWGYDPTVKGYQYDLDRAKQLLDEAGWVPGPNGIRVKDGQPLEALHLTPSDPRVDEFIQANLRDAGISLKVQQLTLPALITVATAGEYNEYRTSYTQNDPDFIRNWLLSDNIPPNGTRANRSFYRNADLDTWLKRAASLPNNDERRDLYARVQHHLVENAVWIPLVDNMRHVAIAPGIDGLGFDSHGWYLLVQDGTGR